MNEAAYWIAITHLPKWNHSQINNLIIKIYHKNKLSLEDFFNLPEKKWKDDFHLDIKEITDLQKAKSELPNNAFLAESLLNQGYELIPIISSEYSKTLKANLKTAYSPPLLYIKGNKEILQKDSIAIVGSRNASEISLRFADSIAESASKKLKVVVSGFAKGVDKQALDSAIKYRGQSIIVLPQGIFTFDTGYKTYYKQIVSGDVLVISTFFPKVSWKAELAMARNTIIYGLANEIYVAESGKNGGTWSGVIDGLRKGRKIFVRQPGTNEENANNLLIENGAVAVDLSGNEIKSAYGNINSPEELILNEDSSNLDEKIKTYLNGKSLCAKELKAKLNLDWSTNKLSNYLKKLSFIEYYKEKKCIRYIVKDTAETMFNFQ